MRHRIRLATLGLLLGALGGCAHGSRRYHDANMDFASIQTVAVLPFQNLSRDQLAGERVRDVFANMLLATNAFYVVPHGEVVRILGKAGVTNPTTPSVEEVVKVGKQLKAGAVLTGVVKEYGEIRSGQASGNAIAVSVQLLETDTGKVVWAASSTQGGVTLGMRLFGGGGEPIEVVTEQAVDDLLDQLFK